MSKTRLELINQAIVDLGVVAGGQPIAPEDLAKMDGYVDPTIAELSSLEIYYVQDAGTLGPADGEIEDAAFLSIAAYLANAACAGFNLPADAKMQVMAQQAEAKLRTLSAPARTLRTLRVDPALRRHRIGTYRGFP